MTDLPGRGASYWVASTPETAYPRLSGTVEVDVAIVGAGITGITAAALLKRAGRTVALLESKRIVHGATGYTTAKLTAGHTLVYEHLIRRFGERRARLYAEANQAAIELVASQVEQRKIDCDFERAANFVYAKTEDEREDVQREADAAARVGLPASFVSATPLPFPIGGAVRLEHQAQFHPRKYLLPLAAEIPGDGSHVFEHTRVANVEAKRGSCRVVTARGEVRARDVIVATHLPILDRGLFFAKAHPFRSYVLALPAERARAPEGMYISSSRPTRSIRLTPHADGGVLVLVAGEGHKTGEEQATSERYLRLHGFAREQLELDDVAYRWSTQDYYTVDKVPYVGRIRRGSKHLFGATGFNGWGMTGGTLAAMLLADRILGLENAWAEVFEAKRLKPRASAAMFVKENAKAGAHFITDGARPAETDDVDSIPRGGGAVVRAPGEKVAVYRDDEGALHALTAVCSHLACIVRWNAAERSWDCPCHGSRFSATGRVIQGPAVRDLERRDPEYVRTGGHRTVDDRADGR